MTDYADLKRRLTQSQMLAEYDNGGKLEQVRNPDGAEAVAAIAALEAEVARLREALNWIYENDDQGDTLYRRNGRYAERARAALADQPAEGGK